MGNHRWLRGAAFDRVLNVLAIRHTTHCDIEYWSTTSRDEFKKKKKKKKKNIIFLYQLKINTSSPKTKNPKNTRKKKIKK